MKADQSAKLKEGETVEVMTLAEITDLVDELKAVLADEHKAKSMHLAEAKSLEVMKAHILAEAYADGTIDGKNAPARARQEQVILSCDSIAERMRSVVMWKEELGRLTAQRRGLEAEVSLIKAWLYSHSGRGGAGTEIHINTDSRSGEPPATLLHVKDR